MKSRKQKQEEYQEKYENIPIDYNERLAYMIEKYNVSDKKKDEIIKKRNMMMCYLEYTQIFITLFQIPEGMPRPRYRIIHKNNYMDAAILNPEFIQVYSPGASDDYRNFIRLTNEKLIQLRTFVQTPCICEFNAYFPTPSYFNVTDIFMAELGLHRYDLSPDWDNIGKKYSDIYNHNVWLDDRLCVGGTVNKWYSILPRVEIKLLYLNYATNKNQYNRIINSTNYNESYPISYLDNNGRPV